MRRNRIVILVALVLMGVAVSVFLNDSLRSQVVAFVNPYADDRVSDSATRSVVDEAFRRVPLPPIPDKKGMDTAAEEFGPRTQQAGSSAGEDKRSLPGISPVEVVADSLSECSEQYEDTQSCLTDYLTHTVQTRGIETAFTELKTSFNNGDQWVIPLCHQLTHVIGRAATTLFPTVAESYNYGDTFCWSGYYHGIMEAIIVEMGIESVPKELNSICSNLPGRDTRSFNYYNCVHGLGHGLMYVEGHNLFKALELCDELTDDWDSESCYGGVYMENVIANGKDHISKYLKEDDLLYPCNVVDEKYKQQCYLMQSSYALETLDYDFAKVFDVCASADSQYINTCYTSIGRDASGNSGSDPEKTKATCLLGPDEIAQSYCVDGAVRDFVSYYHSDIQARTFCEILPENLSNECNTTLLDYYESFTE